MEERINRHGPGMQKRRERIIAAAAKLLAREGFGGLTTRKIAKEAGVTTPTLYNLIGNKDEIVRQMFEVNVESVFSQLQYDDAGDTLAMAENVIDTVYEFIRQDEPAMRELAKGLDHLPGFYAAQGDIGPNQSQAVSRSLEMTARVCRHGIDCGDLLEVISVQALTEQLFSSFRGPFRDWAHGLLSLPEMRRRQLRGFFLILAGIANEAFRQRILDRVKKMEAESAEVRP